MKNKKIATIGYALLFVTITFALLLFAAQLLRDKQTTLTAMYSEPDNTLDVIIVGSSHVNNGYMPNILWEENNLSACNVYSWSQPMWTSYHYIKETLKTQSPKVIVLEMFGMTYGNSYIMPQEIDKTNYANSFNIDIGFNYLQLIQTAEQVGLELRPYEEFLNLPRYHSRWKTSDIASLTYNPHKQKDFLKGYGLTFSAQEFTKPDVESDVERVPYEFSVEYLEKIVALCEQKGITLVFSMVPYLYNETEVEINNWIQQYADAHDILFLNYNGADGERVGIDYATDLADMGHLNYNGALKITTDLANQLKPILTQDKSENTNAETLNIDYAKYNRVIFAQKIMTETDVTEYLAQAVADQNYSLFVLNNGQVLSEDFYDVLVENEITLPADKNNFTLAFNIDGANIVDVDAFDFSLFGTAGDVRFALMESAIYLNDVATISQEGDFKMVLYDNVLQRPLETVVYADDFLQHKEFSSDIINLFKKR